MGPFHATNEPAGLAWLAWLPGCQGSVMLMGSNQSPKKETTTKQNHKKAQIFLGEMSGDFFGKSVWPIGEKVEESKKKRLRTGAARLGYRCG